MTRLEKLLEGLKLIKQFTPDETEFSAEHDIIYLGSLEMPEHIKAKMIELGFHEEEEFNCWGIFT
ncbi:MAG: hypothetical protein ACP5N7_06455 [Candidatus Pacearchaeota archaeon]